MKLSQPFYQLPVRFDVACLQAEVSALPGEAWVEHPDKLAGNSAVRLISSGGEQTDFVHGQMLPTPWLERMPYVRQILASFGVVWGRSRLMRLAPGAIVPLHSDINHNWYTRVRMHIPVITRPEVSFHCDGQVEHMAEGEAWLFDNWRQHHVENNSDVARIHLVADTTGTAAFWAFAKAKAPPRDTWPTVPWTPGINPRLLTEANVRSPVMPAAEVQWLVEGLKAELVTAADTAELRARAEGFTALLDNFVFDWRQLCALHGTDGEGREQFLGLNEAVRQAALPLGEGLVMRTNAVAALQVLEKRVLEHLVAKVPEKASEKALAKTPAARPIAGPERALQKPVFIIAAPRSGSTLLFETLAHTPGFNSFGGEAHWLIGDQASLRPGALGIDSNRLTAADATAELVAAIRQAALGRLQGPDGRPPAAGAPLLEKTPKNALRVPFLKQVFPDARFIFLWRDPRENLGSIMEAWRDGGWITFPSLPGWDGPWSLLLPPGWQYLRGQPLETVAAWQWRSANQIALDDLQSLPAEDWTHVNYQDFLADPEGTVRRLCDFAEVPFDDALQTRTRGQLPLSRYTHTKPAPDKWRRDEDAILRVLPGLEACWQRLRTLDRS